MSELKDYAPFFVYGTLKRGQHNEHFIPETHVERMEQATLSDVDLYSVHGAYPAIKDGSGIVEGELIWVDPEHFPEILRDVDRLEGNGHLYERRLVDVGSIQAWTYYWISRMSGLTKIERNCW